MRGGARDVPRRGGAGGQPHHSAERCEPNDVEHEACHDPERALFARAVEAAVEARRVPAAHALLRDAGRLDRLAILLVRVPAAPV
jgi:hypothetical protein